MIVIYINEQKQASLKWLKNNYGNLVEYKKRVPSFKIVPTTKIKNIMLKSQVNVIEGYDEVEKFMAEQFNMLIRPAPSIFANSNTTMPRPREEGEDDMHYADLPGDIMQSSNRQPPKSNFNSGGPASRSNMDNEPPPQPKLSMGGNSKQEFNPSAKMGILSKIVTKPLTGRRGDQPQVDERINLSGSTGLTKGVKRTSPGVGTGSNLGGI